MIEDINKYVLDRYHNRRQDAIAFLGYVCAVCGDSTDLEFDHIDPASKSFTIGSNTSINEEDFWLEIAKCQLLCKDCHKEKTRRQRGVKHGGGKSGKRNCPCNLCRARKAEYMRGYK